MLPLDISIVEFGCHLTNGYAFTIYGHLSVHMHNILCCLILSPCNMHPPWYSPALSFRSTFWKILSSSVDVLQWAQKRWLWLRLLSWDTFQKPAVSSMGPCQIPYPILCIATESGTEDPIDRGDRDTDVHSLCSFQCCYWPGSLVFGSNGSFECPKDPKRPRVSQVSQ